MAKRKSGKSAKTKPASSAKSNTKHLEVSRGFKPDPEAARTSGVLSDVEIGRVAGDVWAVLSRDGALSIAAIKKAVAAPGDIVVAAIGWLAREHKLVFTGQGRSMKISLR
jgi:hypothetical protein